MKETQQDAAKSQLRAEQFSSHYSKDLFMFPTAFVLNFTADKHSGNVFMDDNKSVVLSVPLHVHFRPICSSSCDLLCCAASLVPQLPSTGRRLNSSSSMMWHWVSNYVLTEKQRDTFTQSIWFWFVEKYQRRGRGVSCFSTVCPAGLDLSHVGEVATAESTPAFSSSWLQGSGFRCASLVCSGMFCGTCLASFLSCCFFGKRHFNHIV